uniref:Potassium channel tetramerisation-type BTB domain-containing protein n=1 Tax=Chromera velia CCMP2878 TaxID=1169474 RepID=A0A0G4GLE7_9ALVE|eukprot:Cvel_22420.t1-p1 / transcript=Cvel_22420.t1 / gene=Cvel_22420 / organism=Chromera_velia_CCMP2878 / gene_product=Influenza virus NS1A-binding protein homolog A, putative / transcript_product=Influenza virus NS1A-binding protein homolog A, putative / location=Cvel_scaffold2200:20672-29401(-) / protein_length=527 / sequence_SO=supercontig / SO=protein_coding / is_pseudo=false
MVGDLRRSFSSWMRKADGELMAEDERLQHEIRQFEAEKEKQLQQLVLECQQEYERIKEERRRADVDIQAQLKQIQIEREDAKHKAAEERQLLDNELETHRRKMILEREKFREEYEEYEKERQRIVDTNIAAETMTDINVGGVIFETSRHTLASQKGSLLEAAVSGRAETQRDRQGRIFFDRDSQLFREVLHFLRTPSEPPRPQSSQESEALSREAEFLGVRFFPFPLVFACGGHDGSEHLSSMELLDVQRQGWRPAASMQTPRSYFGAGVSPGVGRLYLFGGQNIDYKALCDMEVYDVLRDEWMRGASLAVPRRNVAACEMGGRLFAIGGFDGGSILTSVEIFDPRTKGWSLGTPLTTPRSSAMAAVFDEKIYVCGGTRGERLRSVEIFDPKMNRWLQSDDPSKASASTPDAETYGADMIEVRSAGAAACCLESLFVVGGTDQAQGVHESLECFDREKRLWSFRRNMSERRMDCAATVVADTIMVSGGQCGDVLSSVEFYKPETDEWQGGPSMLRPRYAHQSLLCLL